MTIIQAPRKMPYPGLRPFEEMDDAIFFGRQKQVAALLRALDRNRFVAVVGSSGSGKSSLVRAGLLPAVRRGFLLSTTQWETITVHPGVHPYQNLELELRPLLGAVDGSADDLADTLRWTDRGLIKALEKSRLEPGKNLLLVVDQFEELFAYRHGGPRADASATRSEASAFVSMLLATCNDLSANIWIVITMRSDFIGDCEAFLGLPEKVSKCQFLVPRLDSTQIREVIVRPSLLTGGGFHPFTVPEELVNVIIGDAGDRPDQLPLMQHALMRTWKFAVQRAREMACPILLTAEDYSRAGRIDDALSRHAEDAWKEIKEDEKMWRIARRLFLLLCDVATDGQITRRRPLVSEVEGVARAKTEEIERIVRLFQDDDRNFLVAPKGRPLASDDELDVSHEALLRQWKRFNEEWLSEERADAEELRRLAEMATLWKQRPKERVLSDQYLTRLAPWRQRVSAAWASRYMPRKEWKNVQTFIRAEERAVKKAAKLKEAEKRRKEEELQRRKEEKENEAAERRQREEVLLRERAKAEAEERATRARYLTLGIASFIAVASTLTALFYTLNSRDQAILERSKAEKAEADAKQSSKESERSAKEAEKSEKKTLAAATRASEQTKAALRLVSFMQFDLSAKLRPLGKLALMGEVSKQIIDYQKRFPASPDDPEGERSASLALSQYGDILLAQGKTDEALSYLQQSAERGEQMFKADASLQNAIDWANGLSKIGTIQLQRKDYSAATTSFESALKLVSSNSKPESTTIPAQQVTADIEMQLGDVAFEKWDLQSAYQFYLQALQIRKPIADENKDCRPCQRDYAQSLRKKGKVELSQVHWADARKSLDEAVKILKRLYANDPADTQTKSELSKAMGDSARLAMDEYWADSKSGTKLNQAKGQVDDSVEIHKQLVQQDPTNVEWQRELWEIQTYRGQVYQILGGPGGLDTALQSYEDSLEIANRLSHGDPASLEFKSMVAQSYEGVGDAYKYMGNTMQAMLAYDESRKIRDALVTAKPEEWDYLFAKAMIYASMADALVRGHREIEHAKELIATALNIVQGLNRNDRLWTERKPQLNWIEEIAAKVRRQSK